MKRLRAGLILMCGLVLLGCQADAGGPDSPTTPPRRSTTAAPATRPADQVIARLNGKPITLSQLQPPLIHGYGLDILLNIVQLEAAQQQAAREKITVTPQEIANERNVTLAKLFPDADKAEHDRLFDQLLQQQHISRAEFGLVLQTNAYLRKLAEPLAAGKINDAMLEEAFRRLYGETVRVRHIQLANMQEVLEAKRRLAAGDSFAQVAQEMSRNARTGVLGGELPAFSRQANYPQVLKDAAFALKESEVSDVLQFEGAFHLVKLEQRIAPKAVKYEDVKDSLRADLHERAVQEIMKELRARFAQDAIKGLVIEEPVLRQQYDDKLHQRDQLIRDRNEIREQWERDRQRILEQAAERQAELESTTQPTTAPTTTVPTPATTSTAPTPSAPEVARPPATQP